MLDTVSTSPRLHPMPIIRLPKISPMTGFSFNLIIDAKITRIAMISHKIILAKMCIRDSINGHYFPGVAVEGT